MMDIIPFCNGQAWPDLVFEIIQVFFISVGIIVMCCCERPWNRLQEENFMIFGMIVTSLIILLDIIKFIITFVRDSKKVAFFEIGIFVITLIISCSCHPCDWSRPCIPGILCLAILQLTGEIVKHMFVVHYNDEMDGTGCLFL